MIIERLARNPFLWTIFEKVFGADEQKKLIYRSAFATNKSILDFGCSSGNTTSAFLDFDYTGVDIDADSISYARKRWSKHKNIKFICADLLSNKYPSQKYDFILFAGTGHHLSTDVFLKVNLKLLDLLKPTGQIWFYDILKPGKRCHPLTRLLAAIDRGKFIRNYSEYQKLFSGLSGASVIENKKIKVTNTLIPQEDYCFFRVIRKK